MTKKIKKTVKRPTKKIAGKAKKMAGKKLTYQIDVIIGEKKYKFSGNDPVEVLSACGIDPMEIDYWTNIIIHKGKKSFNQLLNVPKMKNLLANRDFCKMIVDSMLYNLNL